ncbi:MAG TPA: phosphatidate cytidylyltransferase, partial [Hyphomicrobiales bacterium]|nr:phosphatidate cytidylyltransferase [Hyphomicrobiales bacterium]
MPADADDETVPEGVSLRIAEALILAPLAILAAWAGSWLYAGLVTLGGALVFDEWLGICGRPAPAWLRALVLAAMGGLASLTLAGAPLIGLAGVVVAALIALVLGRLSGWPASGLLYAGLPVIAVLVLRADPDYGLAATLWLFAIVWATDSAAYASGRLIGGPKLWPRISPNKTWAGFAGGLVAAALVGAVAARLIGATSLAALTLVGVVVSMAAQAGDLFESGVKRRFGV